MDRFYYGTFRVLNHIKEGFMEPKYSFEKRIVSLAYMIFKSLNADGITLFDFRKLKNIYAFGGKIKISNHKFSLFSQVHTSLVKNKIFAKDPMKDSGFKSYAFIPVSIPGFFSYGLFVFSFKENFFKGDVNKYLNDIEAHIKSCLLREDQGIINNIFLSSGISAYAIHEMIFDKNKNPIDYVFLDLNNAFEKMTGLKKDYVKGKKVTEVIKGIESEEFIKKYGEVVKEKKNIIFEEYSPALKKWYLINAFWAGGDRFATLFYDITDKKEKENKIKENEEWYKGAFENSNAVKLIIDPQTGRIVDANKSAVKFYGYSKEELISMKISDINIMKKKVFNDLKKAEKGEKKVFDFVHRLKDGRLRNVRVYSSPFYKKGKIYLHSLIFDTTEELKNKKKLEMLFNIMNKASDEFYLFRAKDLVFEYVNDTALNNLGYSKEEILKMTPLDIKPEFSKNEFIKFISPLRNGTVDRKVFRTYHKRKNGSLYPVEIRLNSYFFDGDLYFFAVGEDVAEKIEKENKLNLLNKMYLTLSQANQSMVRAENEKELFDNLVKIAVDYGGFLGCWVGFKGEANNLNVFSCYGVSREDMEETIKILFVKYKGKPLSITQKAFINKEVAIDNSIAGLLPRYTSKIIKKYNAKSGAAFPVFVGREIRFTVTFYSDKENFFSKDMINLLKELVMDVEYALSKMKSERDVEESEKKYKAIFENSSAGSCIDEIIYDKKGKPVDYLILDVNKAFEKITGIKREEALNKRASEVYKTKQIPYLDVFARVVKTGVSQNFQGYFPTFKKHINMSVSRFSENRFSTVFTDITEEVIYKEKLEKSSIMLSKLSSDFEENIKKLCDLMCYLLDGDLCFYQRFEKDKSGSMSFYNLPDALKENFKKNYNYFQRFLKDSNQFFFIKDLRSESLSDISEKGYVSCLGLKVKTEYGFKGLIFVLWKWEKQIPEVEKHYMFLVSTTLSNEEERYEEKNNIMILNNRYQSLVNNMIDPVCIWDKDTTLLFANSAYKKTYGDFIEGKKWIDWVKEEEKEKIFENIKKIFKNKNVFRYEHVSYDKNGKEIWHDWVDVPIVNEKGEVSYVQSSGREITERKIFESEIIKLKTAIEQAPFAIVITDKNGTIEYVNPWFEYITGYSKEEAIGQNPRVLKSGEHDFNFYKNMWETILNGNVFRANIVNKKKNGEFFVEDAIISPVKKGDDITHFVALKRDITLELKKEKDREQKQRMETVGLVAGGIAHDFNNILTAIMGSGEILLDALKGNNELYEDAKEIVSAAERGSSLVKQLLYFSKKDVVNKKVLDLNKFIVESKKMFERMIGEKYLINLESKSENVFVYSDENSINQILINLITNSRDAMPNGGNIDISVEKFSSYEDFYHNDLRIAKGNYALIKVKDYGTGISEDIKDKIFIPFFSTKKEGTGLGLSTVYSIVRRNNGYVAFESETGKETCFYVYLPTIENKTEEKIFKGSVPKEALDFSGVKVVFVDDEESVRKLGAKLLKFLNIETYVFDNPLKVLSYLEENKVSIDILITDMIMPGMSGKELADKCFEKKLIKEVIYISGYSEDMIGEEKIKEIGDRFLLKPFKIEDFKNKLIETINKIKK